MRGRARHIFPEEGGREEMEGVILAGGQSLANQIREKLNHEQISTLNDASGTQLGN